MNKTIILLASPLQINQEECASSKVSPRRSRLTMNKSSPSIQTQPVERTSISSVGSKILSPIDLKRAKLLPSIINLAHTIIGSGIVGLPYAVAKVGYLLGIIFFLVSSSFAALTLFMMAEVARVHPGETLKGLSLHTIPKLRYVVDGAIITMCFGGGCTSFLICIGDIMPRVAKKLFPSNVEGYFAYKREFWIVLFVLLISPLIFQRTINALRYVSFISFICLLYISSMAFVHAGELETLPKTSWWPGTIVDVLKAAPMFIFMFTCHQNLPQISNELINNTRRRLLYVIVGALAIVLSIYILVGFVGYLVFGDQVSSDYLKSFPEENVYEYGNLLFVIATAFIYPLWSFPARQSLGNVILGHCNWSFLQHFWLTCLVIAISTGISLAVSNLGTVISLVGGTSCTTVSYIIPGSFYYYHVRKQDQDHYQALLGTQREVSSTKLEASSCDTFLRYSALGMVIFGYAIVAMVITLQFV